MRQLRYLLPLGFAGFLVGWLGWIGPIKRLLASLLVMRAPELKEYAEGDPFETAAGHFPRSRTVSIPPEVWESYRGDVLYLRAIDPHSRAILARWAKARIRP